MYTFLGLVIVFKKSCLVDFLFMLWYYHCYHETSQLFNTNLCIYIRRKIYKWNDTKIANWNKKYNNDILEIII